MILEIGSITIVRIFLSGNDKQAMKKGRICKVNKTGLVGGNQVSVQFSSVAQSFPTV